MMNLDRSAALSLAGIWTAMVVELKGRNLKF